MGHICTLEPNQIDKNAIVAVVPAHITPDIYASRYNYTVRLIQKQEGAAAWSGVTVTLDYFYPPDEHGNRQFEHQSWRVEVNWPSTGAQDIARTTQFIELMQTAVAVANVLRLAVNAIY